MILRLRVCSLLAELTGTSLRYRCKRSSADAELTGTSSRPQCKRSSASEFMTFCIHLCSESQWSPNILQNTLFCVLHKKERHAGLEWHKGVKVFQNYFFWVNYPFKCFTRWTIKQNLIGIHKVWLHAYLETLSGLFWLRPASKHIKTPWIPDYTLHNNAL